MAVNEMPEIGKISPEIFNELIFPRLGAKSDKIIVGPQHGVDVGIAEIRGKAVSFTTDPVFIVPEYGWERAAWFAFYGPRSRQSLLDAPPSVRQPLCRNVPQQRIANGACAREPHHPPSSVFDARWMPILFFAAKKSPSLTLNLRLCLLIRVQPALATKPATCACSVLTA